MSKQALAEPLTPGETLFRVVGKIHSRYKQKSAGKELVIFPYNPRDIHRTINFVAKTPNLLTHASEVISFYL